MLASASPQLCITKKNLKLGGKTVEFPEFGHKQLLFTQRKEILQ